MSVKAQGMNVVDARDRLLCTARTPDLAQEIAAAMNVADRGRELALTVSRLYPSKEDGLGKLAREALTV